MIKSKEYKNKGIEIDLTGPQGNAYYLLGLASKWSKELQFSDSYRHFAGKFALKEALIKSIKKKIEFSDILTSHLDLKPEIKIKRNYKNLQSCLLK